MNMAKFITVAEKAHYPFSRFPTSRVHDVLYPGCSTMSQYPRTMDALSQLCRSRGMGVAYDCCGKPLAGFGEKTKARKALDRLRRRLDKTGCQRLVLVCPNCMMHLTPQLGLECVSIYQVFHEWGDMPRATFDPGVLFRPCPDRKTHALEQQIRGLADLSQVESLTRVGCCGLREDIAIKGPEFTQNMTRRVFDAAAGRNLYTYCASCLGQFARMGYEGRARHVLSVMLGVDEPADAGHAIMNRARRKFDRNVEPLTGAGLFTWSAG